MNCQGDPFVISLPRFEMQGRLYDANGKLVGGSGHKHKVGINWR